MDPVNPFFDTGAWMQEYTARRARAGNASQQGDFERRMEDLDLVSSDGSSSKSESPDPAPAADGRAVRRSDFGGSMRMPPHSSSRESSLGDTRRSVDIPRFQLPASAQVSQSGLRDDLFSSARYSLPDAEPAPPARSGKSRGLWSRFKSGVRKAFGGSGGERSSRDAGQPDGFSTTFRVDYARQPGRTRGVSAADEALIADFRNKAAGNLSDGTIKNAAADLRYLSARLSEAGRPSIADRIQRELENAQLENPELENHQLEAELDEDVDTYAKDRGRRIKAALKKLREVGAGNTLAADIRRLVPHDADAALIGLWAAAEKATHRVEPKTIDRQARRLSRLSEWLQTHDRQPMAGRLFSEGFAQDVEEYKQETEDDKINADLVSLGQYQQILDANRALGLQPPEGAGQASGEAARQARTPQELPATPATPSQRAWDWFWQQMQEPASPSSVRPRSSNIYGGLDSFVDLDPPTPYDLRDDARSALPPEFAGASAFAGQPGGTQELRDIGAIVGANWRHGSQTASTVLIDVLGNLNLLPSQFEPSQLAINGERYSATFGPGGHRDVRLVHHPRTGGINEAGPSQPHHRPPQIVRAAQSGEGAVDLGYLIRGGWEHRERFLPPYLVRALEGQRIMPEVGRPTYFEIRSVPYRGELEESEGRRRVRIYPEPG
ncbi:hypothetical protein [Bradyrhizobium altum]|uniref:hypothetical protein n=1 Tax=Bradyrhizobium altum TaxID=1571202 RepID=UPI001E45E7AC|nr:hypothetical protein [Bradyrhizobium altum]